MNTSALPAWLDGRSEAYQHWKEQYLATTAASQASCHILAPDENLRFQPADLARLCTDIDAIGFAWYQWHADVSQTFDALQALHRQLGLADTDSSVLTEKPPTPDQTPPARTQPTIAFSHLEDRPNTPDNRFLPYTNKAMNWHTDGYYNDQDEDIRAFTLYCVNPAASGGALTTLDPCLLLISLYAAEPEAVALLSHPQAMTLPANQDELGHNRPDRHAAVFYTCADGRPGTRFTTRQRNIAWRNDATRDAMQAAIAMADAIDQWHHSLLLQRGQGLITRNVLHKREAFVDDAIAPKRQMLRGRFLQYPSVEAGVSAAALA